jgi:hypothetical protein
VGVSRSGLCSYLARLIDSVRIRGYAWPAAQEVANALDVRLAAATQASASLDNLLAAYSGPTGDSWMGTVDAAELSSSDFVDSFLRSFT